MNRETNRYIRLGIFVLLGTVLLILALYIIGSRQNLFGAVFTLKTEFKSVNGLTEGNNVRYGGINIGTVKSISLSNDSTIQVEMVIDEKMKGLIKKNCVVSVGTDGLMGNKLLNISRRGGISAAAEEGDVLLSDQGVDTDQLMQTLSKTGENMKEISDHLKSITADFSRSNNLWKLLNDSNLVDEVKGTLVNARLAGKNVLMITGDLKELSQMMKSGKGIGALITDTSLNGKINQLVVQLNKAGDSAVVLSGDLAYVSRKLKGGQGTLGMLLNDTTFAGNLNKSVSNLKSGSHLLNEDLEGLKHSFLLKKYFKKKERADRRKKKP